MVVNGDYHEFEPEKLRGLMKILPEMDEVKSDGDTNECLDGVDTQMNIAKNVRETKPRRIFIIPRFGFHPFNSRIEVESDNLDDEDDDVRGQMNIYCQECA